MTKTEILDAAKKRLAELDAERADLLRMIAASGEAAPVAWPHPFPDPLVVPLPFIQPVPHPMTPWVLNGHGGNCACQECCPTTWTIGITSTSDGTRVSTSFLSGDASYPNATMTALLAVH